MKTTDELRCPICGHTTYPTTGKTRICIENTCPVGLANLGDKKSAERLILQAAIIDLKNEVSKVRQPDYFDEYAGAQRLADLAERLIEILEA